MVSPPMAKTAVRPERISISLKNLACSTLKRRFEKMFMTVFSGMKFETEENILGIVPRGIIIPERSAIRSTRKKPVHTASLPCLKMLPIRSESAEKDNEARISPAKRAGQTIGSTSGEPWKASIF